jgi:hypothetical protein
MSKPVKLAVGIISWDNINFVHWLFNFNTNRQFSRQ